MKTLASPGKFPFVLAALCLLFFMPFLGAVHLFDWDEINFAECSREMLLTGEYLRVYKDFEPFHEKPPLFFWLQSISMWLWGLNEYAARFPNAVCGFFTLYLLYLIGKRLYSNTFGIIWAMAYFGSLLPHLYFRSGIIDPWFNFFIFLSLYLFLEYYWLSQGWLAKPLVKNKWLLLFLSASSMGLAILTKGQVAFILVCICFFFYWIVQRFRLFISIPAFLFFTISSFLGMGLWLGIETLQNGTWFVKEFIVYQLRLASEQDAGHGGFFGYHFVVLLFGCFPVSFFALLSYRKSKQEDAKQKDMHLWMLLLLSVVLLVFTLVRTKIVHYSSLAYFPLSFLGARALYQLHTKEFKLPKWLIISLFGFGILIAVLLIAAPFVAMQKELLQSWMRKDAFAVANL